MFLYSRSFRVISYDLRNNNALELQHQLVIFPFGQLASDMLRYFKLSTTANCSEYYVRNFSLSNTTFSTLGSDSLSGEALDCVGCLASGGCPSKGC